MHREKKNGSVESGDAPLEVVAPKAAQRFDTVAAKARAQQTLAHPRAKVVCRIH